MIHRVKTESGTIYRFDDKKMVWEKELKTSESGATRSDKGRLKSMPVLRLHECIWIFSEPFEARGSTLIKTSPIEEFLNEAD
jgi:hypothetical protein